MAPAYRDIVEERQTMRTPDSLAAHRLLPRAERELFQYEIVRFHLEDLNALAERRLGRRGQGAVVARDGERVAAIVQAARWDRAAFLGAIRRFVDEGRAEGAEALGPALLLLALQAEREPFLAKVAPAVLKRARAMLVEKVARASAAPRAPRARQARPARARRS
jgi:hypothetical protein